jgi:REP element-mobilizing transposase RayT
MRDVCADFDIEQIEFNGATDHVHLLVHYPPKISLVQLIGSLKGVFASRLRQELSAHPKYKLSKACGGDPNGSGITIHYQSAVRAHIESRGYGIVANFNDQFSDLNGGCADRTFKLPNPNHYLP